jgi:hypothetical protein
MQGIRDSNDKQIRKWKMEGRCSHGPQTHRVGRENSWMREVATAIERIGQEKLELERSPNRDVDRVLGWQVHRASQQEMRM